MEEQKSLPEPIDELAGLAEWWEEHYTVADDRPEECIGINSAKELWQQLRQVKVELDEAKLEEEHLRDKVQQRDADLMTYQGGLKTRDEKISELRAIVKRYAEALTKPKHCEECGDTGTVARHVCNGNEEVCSRRCPEPEPCEICWTDPNSLFQVIQSALSALTEGTNK